MMALALRDLSTTFGTSNFVIKLLASSFNYLVSGIAVTALGALIPSLELFYNIADGTVAAIFPCTVGGYLLSTACNHIIHVRGGRRLLASISSLFRVCALSALAFGPPFPLCLVAFCALGFGTGLTDSGWSAWASALNFPNVVQGPLHGSFGVGCIIGPVLAVALVTHGHDWTSMYLVLAVLATIELFAQVWAFWDDNADAYKHCDASREESRSLLTETEITGGDIQEASRSMHTPSILNPFMYHGTYMCALFFFIYVSIEFTYSDWIVVFMRRARSLPYNTAGLASSIFWLGMSIGRITLGPAAEHFGVKRSVAVYLTCSALLQLLFRTFRQPTMSMILLGTNGFWIGPTFPSGLVLLSQAVPSSVQVSAVSVACAAGQIGGASIPFLVGIMSDKIGIGRLLDVVLGMTAALIVVWLLFCRISPSVDPLA